MTDTYKFATVTGDHAFLSFLYDRMEHVHKEDHLLDYMHTLDNFRNGINEVIKKADKYDELMAALKITIRGAQL